jgi:hypothetical protein
LARRVDTRRTHQIVVGVHDGLVGEMDKTYFDAVYDTPEEAEAYWNLYRARPSR